VGGPKGRYGVVALRKITETKNAFSPLNILLYWFSLTTPLVQKLKHAAILNKRNSLASTGVSTA
jgi:hypothetical protein